MAAINAQTVQAALHGLGAEAIEALEDDDLQYALADQLGVDTGAETMELICGWLGRLAGIP